MAPLAAALLASNFGSPNGVTTTSDSVNNLWRFSYYLAIPLGLLVFGLIVWCAVRYRTRPGDLRVAKQFQYHIPIEAVYTLVPLVLVAIIFGYMYGTENKITAVSKHPAIKITVEGFQWGWKFTYPNGHQEYGSVASIPDINDTAALPILYMPAGETVQFALRTDDVNHTFYVPEFLLQRDLVGGVDNEVDINAKKPGKYIGECTTLCGTYHALMHFEVDVMSPTDFNTWYGHQAHNSITYAGAGGQS